MSALKEARIAEAYLTNAAACVPPDHGDPSREAVKACRPRLEEQIAVVRPKFLMTLGNPATQRILGKGTITALSGKEQWSNKYGCWVMPLLHPAAVLRAPGRRKAWLMDMIRYGHIVLGEIPLPGRPPVRVFTLGEEGWI